MFVILFSHFSRIFTFFGFFSTNAMNFSCRKVSGVKITSNICICWLFFEVSFLCIFPIWFLVTCLKFVWSSKYKLKGLTLVLYRVDCQCCFIFPCINIMERFQVLLRLGTSETEGQERYSWDWRNSSPKALQETMDVMWFMAYLQGQQWSMKQQCEDSATMRELKRY